MKQPVTTSPHGPDSDTTSSGVRVRAAAQFLVEESDPHAQYYLFAYRIVLTNVGDRRVRLASRHWVIRDAYNEVEEVRGDGVVGEFPDLAPGEEFQYRSCCPLKTHWGTMEGSYRFRTDDGEELKVQVGRFFLVGPADEG